MALFLHSIKCIKYLRTISKLIQIKGRSNKRFLCLANVPNVPETKVSMSTDFYGYQTSEQGVDSLIEKVNRKLQKRKLIEKNMIDEIIQRMQIEGKIDSSQALTVLRSCNLLIQCTPEQIINLATTLWKLFGIYNVQMDVSYYNALLEIYLKTKHEFSPLEILSEMKKQSIEPNEDIYKKLLKYYCMKGNMSGAMTVFQCMRDENHVLTKDVFNSFILGYTQARDLKSAVNVLQIMEKINLIPTNKTYSALMCAYATYNDTKSIQEILSKSRMKNIKFTNQDLLDVIYTLIVNKNVNYVNEMLAELKRPFHMEALEFLAKIIDLKQENIAMKIFYYFYSDIESKSMKIRFENFLIHKLIYSGASIEKIVETCKQFYACYGNDKIFNQAIYYAFKQNEDALVSSLLKEWKDKGHKLKPHYFWPFLTKLQKNHDIKGLLKYVKAMKEVYGVVPCINTVADYILPNLLTPSMSTAFFLSEYNIPIETTRNAIVYYWLSYFKTKLSADYVIQHPCYYDDFILKSKLKWSLFNTCDIDSYLIIANTLYTETSSGAKEKVSLDEKILDVINFLKSNPTRISKILQYISKNEISISDNTYKILSEYQKADSINKTQLLESLREVNDSLKLDTWNIATSKQINVSIVNKLFNEYSREESKKILQKLITSYPTCTKAKLALNYANKLISVGDLNDAAELIKYTGQIIKVRSTLLAKETKKLLNEVALIGNDTILHRFVDILLQQNYITLSTNYINLLITVHIDQGNVREALKIAEMLNNKYNYIPALKKLIALIVLAKDAKILQDFINIAIKTYEEEYILGELILCFLRKDFEEEAKKLIQLFCTSNYNLAVIENISRHYSTKYRSMILEKLLDFTVDYANANRLILYECLAFIYVSKNDHLSVIELWNRMRKEKILPTPKLKSILPVHY